jgi:hypothetical protein
MRATNPVARRIYIMCLNFIKTGGKNYVFHVRSERLKVILKIRVSNKNH